MHVRSLLLFYPSLSFLKPYQQTLRCRPIHLQEYKIGDKSRTHSYLEGHIISGEEGRVISDYASRIIEETAQGDLDGIHHKIRLLNAIYEGEDQKRPKSRLGGLAAILSRGPTPRTSTASTNRSRFKSFIGKAPLPNASHSRGLPMSGLPLSAPKPRSSFMMPLAGRDPAETLKNILSRQSSMNTLVQLTPSASAPTLPAMPQPKENEEGEESDAVLDLNDPSSQRTADVSAEQSSTLQLPGGGGPGNRRSPGSNKRRSVFQYSKAAVLDQRKTFFDEWKPPALDAEKKEATFDANTYWSQSSRAPPKLLRRSSSMMRRP